MKIIEKKGLIKGIKFFYREGTSDIKTFEEVIGINVYEKKDFKINSGEKWVDLGGNVGAFGLLALSKGAIVDIYEPDPFHCKQIEKNIMENNWNANIIQAAVVANNKKEMIMYVGNKMQTWRNSLYKNWGNQKFKVPCIHFSEVIKSDTNVKMDIEGAEMEIIEKMEVYPKKMVMEWSFDIDRSMKRYKNAIDKLSSQYNELYYNNQFYQSPHDIFPKNIFPACDNIYCL